MQDSCGFRFKSSEETAPCTSVGLPCRGFAYCVPLTLLRPQIHVLFERLAAETADTFWRQASVGLSLNLALPYLLSFQTGMFVRD